MIRRLGLILGLVALIGCSALRQSDKAFVADSVAARVFEEDRYERHCVLKAGPPGCAEMQQLLQDLKHANEVANTVQKTGRIPSDQKKEIARLLKQIRSLP